MARTITDSEILDAALELVVQRGYAGATTREIAAAAGINEVTLFRRFGSKEKLLEAVVEQEARKFAMAAIEYTGDLQADLRRVVQFYRDLMQTRGRVIATLVSELPRQPELLEIMHTPLGIFAQIAALIERYQDEGALVREPPMQALVALVGPLFLGGVLAYVQADGSAMQVDPAELVDRFLHGRSGR